MQKHRRGNLNWLTFSAPGWWQKNLAFNFSSTGVRGLSFKEAAL
jgi:hypothetical protein